MAFVVLGPMEDKKIIISEGVRPLWQTLIAATFFTLAVIMLGMFFFGYEPFPVDGISNKGNFGVFYIATACTVQGILFSSVKSILFDIRKNRFKKEYGVGPLRLGRWKKLPKIEYVSVFRQLKENSSHTYEVNMWMKGNKSFTIYESGDLETTFAMGENTAKSLDVNLLDATAPNDFKWVDL
ncbi:hypothetical protein [Arenibacter sp. F20364]|uniref:hypothetical protein n=1 Tax=Arenibacter sp. F20364 TaxID=2926415 RepID=UPI001FF258E6|nr:hypothetical protein [Arenibacter sp. F20364]MCK0188726.1 hypothetical protein [Arenibacter sp. F20364]